MTRIKSTLIATAIVAGTMLAPAAAAQAAPAPTAVTQVQQAAKCPNTFWGRLFGLVVYGPSIVGLCLYR